MKVDICLGGVLGDEGKASVVSQLCKDNEYTHCLKSNGSSNAGHTAYIDGKKFATHLFPTGSVFGIKSIIGPNCVLNEKKFFAEMEYLTQFNPEIESMIKIAFNAHVVLDSHIEEEINENKIGTTKLGVGGAYRDKHARIGVRAESVESFKPFLIDTYQEFHIDNPDCYILAENSQAMGLDINWGQYPYCTSSTCGVDAVLSSGIPYSAINEVIVCAKAYDTYVGNLSFQDMGDSVLTQLGDVGIEFGTTTKRRRKTNYLNLDNLIKYRNLVGGTKLIIKKVDIVRQVGVWKAFHNKELLDLNNELLFKNYIANCFPGVQVIFSETPYGI